MQSELEESANPEDPIVARYLAEGQAGVERAVRKNQRRGLPWRALAKRFGMARLAQRTYRPVQPYADLLQAQCEAEFARAAALRQQGDERKALQIENRALGVQIAAQRSDLGYLDAVQTGITYGHTQAYTRNRALAAVVQDSLTAPARVALSPEQMRGFSMDGAVPVDEAWQDGVLPLEPSVVFDDSDLDLYQAALRGQPSSDATTRAAYGTAYGPPWETLRKALGDAALAGRRTAVLFPRTPWACSACIETGGTPTLVSHDPIEIRSPRLQATTVEQWRRRPEPFDCVIALSVLEHEGLGLHREGIDPDGDLAGMAFCAELLKPGGRLLLEIPVGRDRVVFNLARIYGRTRLPRLFEGWSVAARYGFDESQLDRDGMSTALFALHRTEFLP